MHEFQPERFTRPYHFEIPVEVRRLLDVAVRMQIIHTLNVTFRFRRREHDYGYAAQFIICLDLGEYLAPITAR